MKAYAEAYSLARYQRTHSRGCGHAFEPILSIRRLQFSSVVCRARARASLIFAAHRFARVHSANAFHRIRLAPERKTDGRKHINIYKNCMMTDSNDFVR